jgi:hypothetical protein
MKAERVKTPATTEEVSSHPGEKGHWIKKWHRNTLLCHKETENGLEKGLANLWSRMKMSKITKKAHAGHGQETIWEMSVLMCSPAWLSSSGG